MSPRAQMAALHRRAVGVLWAGTGVLVVAMLLAAGALLASGEREARERIDERAGSLVAGATAAVNRTVLASDLVLAGIAEVLRPAIVGGTRLDPAEAQRLLVALNDRQLAFNNLALLDESGLLLATGLPSGTAAPVAADAALLARLHAQALSQPFPRLVLSEPLVGVASGERALLLGRAVRLSSGQRVVVLAEVPAALFMSAHLAESSTQGVVVTLERTDGTVLLSVPPDDTVLGQRLQPSLAGVTRGQPVDAATRTDGTPARLLVRDAIHPELLVAASLPLGPALAPWRRDRMAIVGGGAALILLTLASATFAHWQLVRVARARNAQARAAATLDRALAALSDGFLICDAEDRVVRWNARYLELFPWLRDTLAPGVPFRRLAEVAVGERTVLADAAERERWIEQRVAHHRAGDSNWEQVLHSGLIVNVVERLLPDGGVVSVYRDVSAAERTLAEAKAAAEAANEAKSQFLANISHEIRTPLNAVLGLNQLLLDAPLPAGQRRYAELVRSSGQLLLALINDILDLARIEAGHLELRDDEFDPAEVAREVVDLLRERAEDKHLGLELLPVPGLPDRLRGDAMRLRQVLFNLVGNALKFTEQGHVHLSLAHEPAPEPGQVMLRIEVADTGIGIAPELLPQLFERFTQADTTAARRHGGSGLGLAITREIVLRMGGDIEAQSTPGSGSLFRARVRLRLAPGCPGAASAAGALPRDTGAEGSMPAAVPPLPGLKTLVAEDNPVNQILIEALLQREGHTVQLVGNGREALQALARQAFELVLMDMQMPAMDGLEAARAIRALPGPAATLPIVAMTANARDEDRKACLAAGMDDYVSKPIDAALLRAAIQRAVAGRRDPHAAAPAPAATDPATTG